MLLAVWLRGRPPRRPRQLVRSSPDPSTAPCSAGGGLRSRFCPVVPPQYSEIESSQSKKTLAEPPLRPFYPFDPAFDLVVTDDIEGIPYPTTYENLARPERSPGRATTTLSARPSAQATTLRFVIRQSAGAEPCGAFEVSLPPEHGERWKPDHADEESARTRAYETA